MKKTGKIHYLFKNMAIFTIGSFVSKLLVFFLVPFYTSILTESEYGIADVMQSSLLLLVPLLSINAGEAALRYGLEYTEDRDVIFLYGIKRVSFSIIPVIILSGALSLLFPDYRIYFLFFIVLYTADAFFEYMLLYCQGTEEVKKMIIGSVSSTFFVIVSNLFFLLVLRMGIYGYLFSQMIAFSLSAALMFVLTGGKEKIRSAVEKSSSDLNREMGVYGKSMLLYSTASWVNNAIDRYFILFLLGSVQNGLYGVAYKIPAILTTVQRIFAMAWQMSAVKEYKGDDREEFFSKMYRSYQTVLVTGCAVIILFLKIIATIMFRKDFFNAWILVPPLLISVVFGALEGFLGSIALAFKDGRSMGIATGVGAGFNIILNYIWIRDMGSFGAACATFVSYFIMFALAFIFVRRHVKLKVFILRDVIAYGLLIAESVLVIRNTGNFLYWNAGIVFILICLYLNEIRYIYIKGTEKIKRRAQ
ncbi:MAG: polysaccharide biosynthesis C-terminal domain-containing protein [Lachnospiraceae bacterium]|nr:polysaccharide biosynthesis C-terminal domain-containing protein [Lachnospiraceae bacterium]